jgi:hypothetical protein
MRHCQFNFNFGITIQGANDKVGIQNLNISAGFDLRSAHLTRAFGLKANFAGGIRFLPNAQLL